MTNNFKPVRHDSSWGYTLIASAPYRMYRSGGYRRDQTYH